MKQVFKLYIDELGMSHPKSHDQSPYYILLGCIIEQQNQRELRELADHIKYKYWGRTDVILHSAEIARNLGNFAIFKDDPVVKEAFLKDLLTLLSTAPVTVTAAIIDKPKAQANNWAEKTVIKTSADKVLFNFLAFLYTKLPARGKVYIEASSWHRDSQYLEAFNELLGPRFTAQDPDFANMRDYLTSINFVTKQNHDIESQVSDLFAYGVRCLHVSQLGQQQYARDSYEAKLIKAVRLKLIKSSPTMGADKKKYYDKIEAVFVAPTAVAERKDKEKRA